MSIYRDIDKLSEFTPSSPFRAHQEPLVGFLCVLYNTYSMSTLSLKHQLDHHPISKYPIFSNVLFGKPL